MTTLAILWAAVWLGWKIEEAAERIAEALEAGDGE